MTTQQTRRPTQVARVVSPQERPVTAAEIRNALQSVVRRLERLEEKVDRLTGMAESSLSESGSTVPPPLPAANPVDELHEPEHAETDLPGGPGQDTYEAEAADTAEPQPDSETVEAELHGTPSLADEPDDLVARAQSESAVRPPPPPPPPITTGFARPGMMTEGEAGQRHSRIAERFAERAPEPPEGDDGGEDDDGYDTGTPHHSAAAAPDGEGFAVGTVRRRHGRSVGRIAFWAVLAVAVVVGGAYIVLDGPGDGETQQAAGDGSQEMMDQPPDETIRVAGQSPLSDDDAAAQPDDATPTETAADAGTEPPAEPDEPTVEMGPLPGETTDQPPDAVTETETADDAATAGSEPPAPDDATVPESDDAPTVEMASADQPLVEASGAQPVEGLSDGPGPDVASVPVGEVEAIDLGDLAPLPEDAPDTLREVAALALEGNPEAQHDLATAYAIGTSIPQNFERAAFWYARSADAGVVNARYNLGVLTERGLGVEQNSETAFRMFLEAAEANHPDAQNAVGLAYMYGNGTQQDLLQAATWFQAASGQGNPRGAYHLGRLFEQGLDGAPDLTAAAGWYRVAAEAGDAQAEEALARITPALEGEPTDNPPRVDVPIPESTPEPVTPGTAQDLAVTRQEIEEIQRLLSEHGYEPGPADGLMGPSTRTAIEAFERDNNLSISGEPSFSLLEALRAAPVDQAG